MPLRVLLRGIPPFVAAGLLAACADRLPSGTEGATAPQPAVRAELRCMIQVAQREVLCQAPARDGGAWRPAIFYQGGGGVMLGGGLSPYDSATQTVTLNTSVRNYLTRALGTVDGTTPDADGVRVFFFIEPAVAAGTGTITIDNADGTGTFTATNQPYYQYDEVVQPGTASSEHPWVFGMPPTVSAFYFSVGVAAQVPYPDGWVEVGPQPSVRVGGTQAYTATVRDASGAVVTGETLTWSISDTTVATVDASGVVHGVAPGTATLSAVTATRPAGITAQVTVTAAIAFASLAAGHQHACGLESGGQAWCWGFNGHGRLGVGATLGAYLVPTAVQQPAGVAFAQLSAGGSHTCAVTGGGQAWCWGNNVDGRLGDGSTTNRNTPAAVQHPAGVTFTQLGVGVEHTCALDTGGQAWCWGQNGDGQLGDSTTTARTAPVAVRQPAGVAFAAIRAGGYHSCGLTSAGQAWCWGRNGSGQLGDSTTTMRTAPVAVKQPAGVALQGLSAGYRHTCGVTSLGQAWCWGQNAAGQLGNNATANRKFPVQVQQGSLWLLSVAAGYDHTCAVASSGAGWCWGANARGQLGDWTTTGQLVPVAVLQPAGISFIAAGAGDEFSCALGGGQSFCWGKNANGQLGDSTRVDRSFPAASRH